MGIEKQANNVNFALCSDYYYSAAREAMKDFMAAYAKQTNSAPIVFVPAYIGISPKEGSGIYDPLEELSDKGLIEYEFYRVDKRINIVFADLKKRVMRLEKGCPFIILRVNYFGFQDPCSKEIFELAEAQKGVVLEDDAHGFSTFQRQGNHWAHAAFFSLHKQFAFASGGMLRILDRELFGLNYSGEAQPQEGINPWTYDTGSIAEICRANFERLANLSRVYAGTWTPLRSIDGDWETIPQTFPILLNAADRFAVYVKLNEMGYGVTSLYHTMIEPIRTSQEFPDSHYVAQRVLNLPVHQDVDSEQLEELVEQLAQACAMLS